MSRKRRRVLSKKKIIRFFFFCLLVIGLSLGCYYKFFNEDINNNDFSDDNSIVDNTIDNIIEKEELEDYKISMVMVGDNLIHDSIYKEAYKNTNYNGYDFSPSFELLEPIISNYDLAYYNQETILGGSEIGLSGYPAFNSPYEVGDALVDIGFNLVSLATNHTLDRGVNAVNNSRNYWNSKDSVMAVGSYSSFEERDKLQINEINNITYTMLNYTYGTNGISVPSGKEYLVNIWPMNNTNVSNDSKYQEYKEQVRKDIESVRDKVDVLIVAMHWGVEYQTEPNGYQKDCALFLANLGVDIIIGTHPHVVQPIEYIDDTLVIYSLGNFFSAHEVVNIGNRVGLMSSIDIIKDRESGDISISNLENELLYTYYTSDYKDFKIVPFSDISSDYLSNYEDVYNTYSEIVKSYDDSIYVKPLE